MERRRTKRFSVSGEVQGRVVLSSECAIRDISASGMKFMARRRILPATSIRVDLGRDGKKLNIHAQVLRSNILSTGTDQDGEGPLYEVAVTFIGLEDTDRQILALLTSKGG